MASRIETQNHETNTEKMLQIYDILDNLGMTVDMLQYLPELSPYLILDGHRTGIADSDDNPARGYVEGAMFSLRFAKTFKELGGKKSTFLIHTLRNYATMDRMTAIFDAVNDVGGKFISKAVQEGIRLRYFGSEVHSTYALADIINVAESKTCDCEEFELNYLTNYSEIWGADNFDLIEDIPEISVIGRFTKGHYSGVGIPNRASKANFIYIQNASVNENWTDMELITLILTLLKSHLALKGFVGGKSYQNGEREQIRQNREIKLHDENYQLSITPSKRIISFSPIGPISVMF